MKKILVFNINIELLKNYGNYMLVDYFDQTVDYIITDDLNFVNVAYQDLVLRNIEMIDYDVNRSIELYNFGLRLKEYSIISSNCMAGFVNQFICNRQTGPCAFWRFDPKEFYQLLMEDKNEFLHSFTKDIKFYERNGHYYGQDNYRVISFNHYKKKTNDEIQAIYYKRLKGYKINKNLIVLGLDRLTFSYEEVLACATKYPEVIIVTNYKVDLANVFSYENTDEQFYLKCMQFLKYCNIEQFSCLIPKEKVKLHINYEVEAMRQFNQIITLVNDVNNKREQLKILSKRLANN